MSVSITAGVVIVLCVLILSYMHTASLFERSGYTGVFAHIGVIGFELTFVLGTVIVVWSKWIGEKVAGSSRFVLILGVLVNLYSNITSGIAREGEPLVFVVFKGIAINEAVLIGALIPCLFIAAEMVVTDAIFKYKAKAKEKDSPPLEKEQPRAGETRENQPIESAKESAEEKPNDTIYLPHVKVSPMSENEHEGNPPAIVAANILESEGQLPGRRRLAKMAGVTEWQARQALEAVKDQQQTI